MGCGTSFVKYVLFFFNLLFALVGLAMIGIGVAVLFKSTEITQLLQDRPVAPYAFIVIGALVFLIAFFGCCGAIRESHCMVVTYAIFLLVIIIVQVALAVLLFVYGSNIKESLVHAVDVAFNNRSKDAHVFASIEEQLQCCGREGPSDYGLLSMPRSCCPPNSFLSANTGTCTIANSYTEGCSPKMGQLYEKWNNVIAGVAIGVACVEVVGALFALCLANSIRNMDRRYA